MTKDLQSSLVNFLQSKYREALVKRNVDNSDGKPFDVDEELSFIDDFITFCEEYMAKNRPTSIQHTDMNYLIKLMGGQDVYISPPVEHNTGEMQPSTYHPVTGSSANPDPKKAQEYDPSANEFSGITLPK